jgi:ankyrin repeat protein
MDLIAAVRYGTRLTPELLLPHKLEAVDTNGSSALHIATILNRADAVWALCTAGACPVATNDSGCRPIEYATSVIVHQILTNATKMQPYRYVSRM